MYREDLAAIQHAGFGGFAEGAAPGLLALLREAGIHEGSVVDLGCGAGVWLRALERAGYDAVGIDASAALVRIAKRVAPRARVSRSSIYACALPPAAAVTAISEVLSYLPAPPFRGFFRRVARSLPRGGLFLFDVMVDGPPLAYQSGRTGRDWAVIADVHEDRGRRRLVRDITTFRRRGAGYRRAFERHEQRVARHAEIESALRAAGFSVRAMRRYGGLELPPRRLAFRARRR